jgi:hypothetical protein
VEAERSRRAATAAAAAVLLALLAAGCAGERTRGSDVEPAVSMPAPFLLRYAGTVEFDSELEARPRPGPLATELRAVAAGSSELRLEQRIWFDGRDAAPALTTTIVAGDKVFSRDGDAGPFLFLSGPAARSARELAELVWRAPAPIAGGSGDSEVRRERWLPHPRLGDVRETADYRHVSAEQGRPVAHELAFEWYGDQVRQKAELKLEESAREPALAHELGPPAGARAKGGEPPRVKLIELAPGVFAAEESESGVRSLVVLFEREIVVVEAPLSSAAGERVVDAVAAAWPKRPIGHVLLTDVRPRFSGGLRAFLAAGATIVTTAAAGPSVQAAVLHPFTLEPDRLARRGGSLRIETFSEGRRFSDATNELAALRIGGADPDGGDAVAIWLPRARLLFCGEPGAEVRDLAKARALDVERLLPALDGKGATGPIPFEAWVRSLAPAGR